MSRIITVQNLSKKYTIGHQTHGSYQTFRDTLAHQARSLYQRVRHPFSPNPEEVRTEEFWALKDINFEVNQGDRIGIIGRNGAGKSTLLKILSRITHPTTGRIHLKGRVSSLLEVGTGFHPELTGRENIFLNGAVLGMGKLEIKRKFDEIVAFAEVEKFLDTPVKRYSSGMYVRLAFSVAAHLEPEILIIDEVLAVGDVQFQKKCLGKMEEVGEEGRTVLFVSHNMGAIQQLTKKCLLLDKGQLNFHGNVLSAIERYQEIGTQKCKYEQNRIDSNFEDFKIERLYFDNSKLEKGFNKPFYLSLDLKLTKIYRGVSFGFGIVNSLGARVMTLEKIIDELPTGTFSLEFELTEHYLPPGRYSLTIGFGANSAVIVYNEEILTFELPEVGVDNTYLIQKKDRIGVFRQPDYKIHS